MLDTALRTMVRYRREKLPIQATDIEVRDQATAPLHHQFNIEAMIAAIHNTPRPDGLVLASDITAAH